LASCRGTPSVIDQLPEIPPVETVLIPEPEESLKPDILPEPEIIIEEEFSLIEPEIIIIPEVLPEPETTFEEEFFPAAPEELFEPEDESIFKPETVFIVIPIPEDVSSIIDPDQISFESVMYKIMQNSFEIEKYYLFDRTGELIVRADIPEINQITGRRINFQVTYNLKQLQTVSAGLYLVPFTVRCLENGEVREDSLFWRPQRDGSGILLSFDDHYFEVWERYFDLFDRYNARATFFIIGRYNNFSASAIRRGHDIGYHSLTHYNLPRVSRSVFMTETTSAVEGFRNSGVPLLSFAYPYGLYETWMHEELLKTYRILRGFNITFQAYNRAAITQGIVYSKSVDNVFFPDDNDFRAAIDLMLRTVKFAGQDLVLPISSHIISETAEWGIKPGRLEYIFRTANELQLNFYRYRDFF